jgi:hypothetical protein
MEDAMRLRTISLIAALVLLASGLASATCNSTYVRQTGPVITVLPSNADDTPSLQCAFDIGSTMPGAIIQLQKGTYITDRIVVNSFRGTLRGMGIDSTIIRNPKTPIFVIPDDFYMTAPSTGWQYPFLFVFLGGDHTVTDLTVSIVGEEPATDWSIFGIRESVGHGIKALAGAFVIMGSDTQRAYRQGNATFYHVKVTGQATSDPLFGTNLINGIFYEGFVGPDLKPLKGRFTVSNSLLDTVGSAAPVFNLVDSWVSISGNMIVNSAEGTDVVDLKQTMYEFSHNKVTASMGVMMYDDCLGSVSVCGMQGSELFIRNNRFRGANAVLIDATFSNNTSAVILANNFNDVTDIAVRLGPNTSHCLAIGNGQGTVQDLGAGNVVIGMQRAGGGKTANTGSTLRRNKQH